MSNYLPCKPPAQACSRRNGRGVREAWSRHAITWQLAAGGGTRRDLPAALPLYLS